MVGRGDHLKCLMGDKDRNKRCQIKLTEFPLLPSTHREAKATEALFKFYGIFRALLCKIYSTATSTIGRGLGRRQIPREITQLPWKQIKKREIKYYQMTIFLNMENWIHFLKEILKDTFLTARTPIPRHMFTTGSCTWTVTTTHAYTLSIFSGSIQNGGTTGECNLLSFFPVILLHHGLL